ncbi:MAG: FHA domain-containing serine/threonine-protein kinase [Thermoproteaceae archaeon]|nr:FHA domain-containing serine/threonine-protein kinase [Thermoproteaceae archaeon]
MARGGLLFEGASLGGRYVVRRRLGEGGMAIVWLVEDKSGRPYAVKEPIIKGVEEREALRNVRFVEHEGRMLSMISHPNVCSLYGQYKAKHGKLESVIVVLEYMDGGSLRCLREPLSPGELKDVLLQILGGLAAVHGAGIIHRDIKPSNLMKKGGVVKLIDFGTSISRFQSAQEVVASPGGYTAPEQLRGLNLFQNDVWSVGATVLYLATKKHPCQFMRNYDCSASRAPGEVELKLPDLGDDLLNRFAAKALAPDYSQRFADAGEALAFLTGRVAERRGLTLMIKARAVSVQGGTLYIGRTDKEEMDLKVEGELLYIYDPDKYISRRHLELAEIQGKWYMRDLGSTNKTAVYRGGKWHLVWRGRGATSRWFELNDGDVIALGYDEEKGAYILITVRL